MPLPKLRVTVAPVIDLPVEVAIVAPRAEAAAAEQLAGVLAAALGSRIHVRAYFADAAEALGGATCKAIAEGCDVVAPIGGDDALVAAARAAAVAGAVVLPVPAAGAVGLAHGVGHRNYADVVAALDRGRVRKLALARCRYRGADGTPRDATFFAAPDADLLASLRGGRSTRAVALDDVSTDLEVLVRRPVDAETPTP